MSAVRATALRASALPIRTRAARRSAGIHIELSWTRLAIVLVLASFVAVAAVAGIRTVVAMRTVEAAVRTTLPGDTTLVAEREGEFAIYYKGTSVPPGTEIDLRISDPEARPVLLHYSDPETAASGERSGTDGTMTPIANFFALTAGKYHVSVGQWAEPGAAVMVSDASGRATIEALVTAFVLGMIVLISGYAIALVASSRRS